MSNCMLGMSSRVPGRRRSTTPYQRVSVASRQRGKLHHASQPASHIVRKAPQKNVKEGAPTPRICVARLYRQCSEKCGMFVGGLWRNGSASDSRSEGWAFESLWAHFHFLPHVDRRACAAFAATPTIASQARATHVIPPSTPFITSMASSVCGANTTAAVM